MRRPSTPSSKIDLNVVGSRAACQAISKSLHSLPVSQSSSSSQTASTTQIQTLRLSFKGLHGTLIAVPNFDWRTQTFSLFSEWGDFSAKDFVGDATSVREFSKREAVYKLAGSEASRADIAKGMREAGLEPDIGGVWIWPDGSKHIVSRRESRCLPELPYPYKHATPGQAFGITAIDDNVDSSSNYGSIRTLGGSFSKSAADAQSLKIMRQYGRLGQKLKIRVADSDGSNAHRHRRFLTEKEMDDHLSAVRENFIRNFPAILVTDKRVEPGRFAPTVFWRLVPKAEYDAFRAQHPDKCI